VRSVIVFGGSAGGIQALCSVLEGLPGTVDAAALAVIHTTDETKVLPKVLGRCSELKVVSPQQTAEPIAAGHLYVPAPNRHLIVSSHCALSWMGPRENRHRPAVDALFRTAARHYRDHVIAVVLSGALDDGSAGALAVKARGGTVIVQDPSDAEVPDMPANVLRQVKTDHRVRAAEIPALLSELIAGKRLMKTPNPGKAACKRVSRAVTIEKEPSGFSCPDCGGVLLEVKNNKSVQFRCHVGHTFSLESFTEAQADALERALWVALRRLNEQRTLQESLARRERSQPNLKRRYLENMAAAESDMRLLHQILARL
jgi:two-component system, chemotaxis family, protein-glutamate methylesterase/glutaminase